MSFEVNFDGLVGPTHNYAGLSAGNIASMKHRGLVANPRQAALQGLAKMRYLYGLGLRQAFLPPLERPSVRILKEFGFTGSIEEILKSALSEAPELLRTACSASSMWTANAATVSPSTDTIDGKTHFTPANLISNVHRSMEAREVGAILRKIFPDDTNFQHHKELGGGPNLGDEGAANHTRLAPSHSHPNGLHLFVYGFSAYRKELPRPKHFVARQSLEASQCVARLNHLDPKRCVFIQQNPEAIDAGVFHNDVIATGNENVLLCHEYAYIDMPKALETIQQAYRDCFGDDLIIIEVPAKSVSIEDAVRSYLFNSQLISLPTGRMALVAPEEARETPAVNHYIESMLRSSDNPVDDVFYMDLRASMCNGGGPACLRLRVVLDDAGWGAVADGVKISESKLKDLEDWVMRHYRESMTLDDLGSPDLYRETQIALSELAQLVEIPDLYD